MKTTASGVSVACRGRAIDTTVIPDTQFPREGKELAAT